MIRKSLDIIPRSLIKNKRRSISIAISIILSIILITSMEILIRSLVAAGVEARGEFAGKYHASYRNVYKRNLDVLQGDNRVEDIGVTAFLGYAALGQNKLEVSGIDEMAINILCLELMEGNYPVLDDEIVIEKWILDKYYPGIKVGDKIKFHLKYSSRMENDTSKIKEVELTLSGILDNIMDARITGAGKGYLTMKGAEKIIPAESIRYKQYFTIKNNYPIEKTIENVNDRYEKNIFGDYEINTPYLSVINASQNSRVIVIIIDIIIAFIASIMIYNIFNISINERIKQFGLLKSIGITPLQMKGIVIGEAILLGMFCIPIGIVFGINLTKLLFNTIGIGGFNGTNLVIDSKTYSVGTISITGFLSLILASYKPAKLAAKVSPIEALRSENPVKKYINIYKNNEVKNNKYFIGYIGKMAYKNIRRNKKRFIATVMSISMGVAIFIAVNYLIDGIDPMKEIKKRIRSDYIIQLNNLNDRLGYSDDEIEKISEVEGIKKVSKYKFLRANAELKIDNMTEYGIKTEDSFAETSDYKKSRIAMGRYDVNGAVIGCNKENMEEIQHSLVSDVSKDLRTDIPGVFLVQNLNGNKMINLKAGDIIKLQWGLRGYPEWQNIYIDVQIIGILNENPFKMGGTEEGFILITDESNIENMFGINGYQRILIDIDEGTSDIALMENNLENMAASQKSGSLVSFREELEAYERVMKQITIILYVIFAIAAITALVNITNTISMNVITRKREFGMLRAIGMTKGQIRKMIIVEGLAYGFAGTLIGSIFGIAFSYLIYYGMGGSIFSLIAELEWQINYFIICMILMITMLLTTTTTLIPLKRTTSMEIVEATRAVE